MTVSIGLIAMSSFIYELFNFISLTIIGINPNISIQGFSGSVLFVSYNPFLSLTSKVLQVVFLCIILFSLNFIFYSRKMVFCLFSSASLISCYLASIYWESLYMISFISFNLHTLIFVIISAFSFYFVIKVSNLMKLLSSNENRVQIHTGKSKIHDT
jgi:hypothetical protein